MDRVMRFTAPVFVTLKLDLGSTGELVKTAVGSNQPGTVDGATRFPGTDGDVTPGAPAPAPVSL